ncbi:bifunctional non-homologous end joining protein LigD [Spinactinospora alkalitolerans]|uniref:Bifunctional non-homologous end joining protein LigD n=1 Tax=Spinactinospora alkalitolerans TaxID=687207 RepID=A0A852TZ08_9ACTN|nr:non-homologous end-joining DNA ligase [Spinactinospora alkalitolerans]NYE48575.1 bifunctional non-homologous end joining protein LigD [Spinactinospora alkalitolerans]
MGARGESVRVGGRRLDIGNPDKELFGSSGITKRDLAAHYRSVGPAMLPHVKGRPLALHRFPDGIDGEGFFQKRRADHAPDWVEGVTVPREKGSTTMVVANGTATLVWLAGQAVITLHPWLSRADDLNRPDRVIIDLDPPGDDFPGVRRAARDTRRLLEELGAPAFLMTTGSRGLHVVVPVRRRLVFDECREIAHGIADRLAQRHPDRLTTEVRKDKRGGRLFVDVLRNSYAQHAVAPYSVRPLAGAPVATPLHWEELDEVASARQWTVRGIGRRIEEVADPWRGMGRRACSLPAVAKRLRHLDR